MASSIRPSVNSPPCKCAIGILANIAAITADKISYLSPKTRTKSGFIVSNASPNPANPIEVDLAKPKGASDTNSKSILRLMIKPSP